MTRPFFKRDRISDFELFDRHSRDAIASIQNRLREGYPIDFQDVVSRFAMDSSSEFLFGHNPHTLAAGLPYPSHITAKSTSIANTDASNAFAGALNLAQVVTMQRGAFGAAWPLTEFWHNRLTAPMRVVRNFLDPILSEAVARRRANGEEKVVETGRGARDRTMLRDEILNISNRRSRHYCLPVDLRAVMLTSHPNALEKLRAEVLSTVRVLALLPRRRTSEI
ncbi:hypothetical protein B0H14DRAFT_2614182 [Mycena olivaceomarginata]|nr:hypothetical protein B0H14DRAFT_2614182 [Mycena olivaceomarginata]